MWYMQLIIYTLIRVEVVKQFVKITYNKSCIDLNNVLFMSI